MTKHSRRVRAIQSLRNDDDAIPFDVFASEGYRRLPHIRLAVGLDATQLKGTVPAHGPVGAIWLRQSALEEFGYTASHGVLVPQKKVVAAWKDFHLRGLPEQWHQGGERLLLYHLVVVAMNE